MKEKASSLNELNIIEKKMTKLKGQLADLPDSEANLTKKERMTKRFKNLEKKKSKILINFDSSFRSYIERLDNKYENNGVVLLNDSICPGCFMKLPIREAYRLNKPNNFYICSNCGRIILSQVEK